MPLDNFEKIFRDQLESLKEEPLPGSTWDKNAAWEKLKPTLPAPSKKTAWYYYVAAAILLFGLGLGFLKNIPVANTKISTAETKVIASNKVKSGEPNQIKPKTPEIIATFPQEIQNPPKLMLAASNKSIKFKNNEAQNIANKTGSASILIKTPNQSLAATNLATSQINIAPQVPAPASSPGIKITIILGANTMERLEPNLVAETSKPKANNKIKVTFKLAGKPTDEEISLATAPGKLHKPLSLSTQIDL